MDSPPWNFGGRFSGNALPPFMSSQLVTMLSSHRASVAKDGIQRFANFITKTKPEMHKYLSV